MELIMVMIDLAPRLPERPALDEDLTLTSFSPQALSIGSHRSSMGVTPYVVGDFNEFAAIRARR